MTRPMTTGTITADARTDFDVIIAGGGMVGATLACLLQDTGLKIALLDKTLFDENAIPFNSEQVQVKIGEKANTGENTNCSEQAHIKRQAKFDPRVSAITPASKKLFDDIGIWQCIVERRACNYGSMHVWDADGTGSLTFSAEDINQPELGSIVENSVILAALYERLGKIQNLQLLAPCSIEGLSRHQFGDDTVIQIETAAGDSLTTKLLVAADGGNSKVRQLANFDTSEWDYNHQALVTTVRTELAHQETALQRFMPTGPLAFLPLIEGSGLAEGRVPGGSHYCSIVWSSVPEKTEELMALSDDQFKQQLAIAIEHRLGHIEWSDRRYTFPLRQRHARSYIQDNIVLVGDAAHTIHPLAGQGVNLGLLDVKALAGELLRGMNAGRNPADLTVLQRYQRKRIGHNLGMMWLMEGFKHLFAEQALPVRWLRNVGMTSVDNLSSVKNHLARRAMGLDW